MAKRRTHCRRGHEFTPENTIWRKDGKSRTCRTCKAEWNSSESERTKSADRMRSWYSKPENRARQAARIKARREAMTPEELEAERAKQREYARRWREANPEKKRANILKHRYRTKYGMNDEQIAHVMAGGLCDSCGMEPATDVDHCHARNVYRGFLCGGCNRAAGMLRDNPARADALAEYLRKVGHLN